MASVCAHFRHQPTRRQGQWHIAATLVKAPGMTTAPTFGMTSLLVGVGGGVGAWLRYLTGRLWLGAIGPVAASAFPYATLTANVLGSLCMGLLVGWMAFKSGSGGEQWRLLLGVGLLGGYTTFSSFAMEFALFIERGALGMAAIYVATTLAAGFAAMFGGMWLMRIAA